MAMTLYIHHVPGRLRLRIARLKASPRACDDALAAIAEIPGVVDASANPDTGSLLIHYDRHRAAPEALWRALCDHGLARGESAIRTGGPAMRAMFRDQPANGPADQIFRAVARVVVETLVARSAAAILGALV
ncbi:MAG TPA: hypothetical protein VGM07_01880 [Stellaceae bacterium]|jgi:hypothetical protein